MRQEESSTSLCWMSDAKLHQCCYQNQFKEYFLVWVENENKGKPFLRSVFDVKYRRHNWDQRQKLQFLLRCYRNARATFSSRFSILKLSLLRFAINLLFNVHALSTMKQTQWGDGSFLYTYLKLHHHHRLHHHVAARLFSRLLLRENKYLQYVMYTVQYW